MRRFLSLAFLAWMGGLLASGCSRPEPGPAAKPEHQSRAKSHYDANRFVAALDSLDRWHAAHATGWNAARQPGRARAEVDSIHAGTTYVVPEELCTLWRHHDGTAPGAPAFDGAHVLLSSAGARAVFDSLRSDPATPWRHNWIPLMRGDGEWIAVEASRRTSPAAPVILYRAGETPIVAATNLTLYFAMVVRASDAMRYDGERQRVIADPAAWERAHAESDPEVPFAWSKGPHPSQP